MRNPAQIAYWPSNDSGVVAIIATFDRKNVWAKLYPDAESAALEGELHQLLSPESAGTLRRELLTTPLAANFSLEGAKLLPTVGWLPCPSPECSFDA